MHVERRVLTAHSARAERTVLPPDHGDGQSSNIYICRVCNDGGRDGYGELEHEPGLGALALVAMLAGGVVDDGRESSGISLVGS